MNLTSLLAISSGNVSVWSNLKVTVLPLVDSSWHSTMVSSTLITVSLGERSWVVRRRFTFFFSTFECFSSNTVSLLVAFSAVGKLK